jgi:O-antigen/teichoic acid export membrane protein
MNLSKDVIYYAFIKGIGVLYWIALTKLSALYLTPEEFGNFSIAFSLATVVAILWTGWQSASLMRFYHENDNKIPFYATLIKGMFRALLWVCVGWISVFSLVKLFSSNTNVEIVLLAIPLSIFYGLHLFIVNILRIKRELRKLLLLNIVQALIIVLGFVVLVDVYNWVAAAIVLTSAYAMSLFVIKRKFLLIRNLVLDSKKREYLKKSFMSYGLPVLAIGIVSQLLSTSDLLILKLYGYVDEVGIYSANYNIAEKSIFAVLSIIVSAFVPIIYKKSTQSNFDIKKEIRNIVVLFLSIALPITLILWVYAPEISIIFLEDRYTSGYFVIQWVAMAGVFVGVASFYAEIYTLAEKTKVLAKLYFVPLLVNITLNLLFIKSYGMVAAIYSTVFSYALLAILIYKFSFKYQNR